MPSPLENVSCACLPRETLVLLAGLRIEPGVRAALTDHHVWIRWEAGDELVLQTVMPIHDAVLFDFHEGRWHEFGQTLPAFDFPPNLEFQPLSHVLFPAPVQPIPPASGRTPPVQLALQRDDRPRHTTALLCSLSALSAWSDTVPTARLASLRGMCLDEVALVLGDPLPLLDGSTRFWGRDVLIALGYAPEPALPESALKQAVGLQDEELLLWQPDRAEVVPKARLAPLSRAGIRLA